MLSHIKAIGGILGLFTVIILQYFIISGSYKAGYTACNEENQTKILELQLNFKDKEKVFNERVEALSVELAQTRLNHENTIDKLKHDFSNELRKSEQRAEVYKRYAESDSTKQRALASHTAQLDRSLTEGRELVRELTETIRVRDAQLRSLGIYIQERTNVYEQ